ncbi:MAG: sigma-70 family RNA polymerase sigma factor [Acidobacteria bacterium]|nr:sigma-70 family RNA polymerase sigma factor [Acidobacteriota bacterium]
MSTSPADDLTRLLHDWSHGDSAALPQLMELTYPELHRIAARHLAREGPGHTLQPTALVNEAYLRFSQSAPGKAWTDRRHFFAVAARVVRAVLVDHARARDAVKRGDGARRTSLTRLALAQGRAPVDVLDLDAALTALEAMNPEHSRIVELRYFAGLSIEETAATLDISTGTVKRGWVAAKTYIRRHLDGDLPRP